MLYLVPTPIGHLQDITLRALDVLKNVETILAEDTRTTGILLKHHDIKTRMISFHAHNEHQQTPKLIEWLKEDRDLALVTDAGSPGISDPGFLIVRACVAEDIEVQALPGATAFVPALTVSGLPCDKFHFEGFLPQKKGRQTRWKFLADYSETVVLYESPHRIEKCLREIIEHLGADRLVSISREITKIHEEHIRGTAKEVAELLSQRNKLKGEIVVVIGAERASKG